MTNKHRIPPSWPQEWEKEYEAAAREIKTKLGHSHLFNSAVRHIDYCATAGKRFLSCDAIVAHRHSMRCELSWCIANAYANKLVGVARKRNDKIIRDDLLEFFRDRRSGYEMLMARHVPREVEVLAHRALQRGEITRQELKSLDHYLRVIDRLGSLPAAAPNILAAFWRYPPTSKHCCDELGKAAAMIDLFLPGSPDANRLRAAMRSLRPNSSVVARSTRTASREIAELVGAARQKKPGSKGRAYSDTKRAEQRGVLMRLERTLKAVGRSFALDREAIDIFAQHAHAQFKACRTKNFQVLRSEEGDKLEKGNGWSAIYIARTFETLADFVEDAQLRADLLADASDYHLEAKKEPKRKERHLAERPTTLPELFAKAVLLVRESENVPVKSRTRLLNAAAIVALLCSYPLRRSDLVRLRYGHELVRLLGGWCLSGLDTQKTGEHVEPLHLPSEITQVLDAGLLQGANESFLWQVYSERAGRALWADWKTGLPLSKGLLTSNIKELVGYSPHIFRTVWADHLIENGADRAAISIILQHGAIISQKEYEFLASKLRLSQGITALAEVIDDRGRGEAAP
ncbi:hypothetical protein BMG03_12790 [Thioclava nitratireducens]|uniref:Tyr recombinase domain-containing protein n=1 Tax=Thioclava nitratireducens TaxID=1915078 RepID=A0ABN4XGA4_9RHOB|nr:site-specific integrase [Thioclava nitratireducens]AQS48571.1 hypothetical protein BMG03_12790 [Thioclava nitratireducens]